LRQSHAAAQRAGGRQAWPTPLIHDWESWLDIQWHRRLQNDLDAPSLLTPLQERMIWKRIASRSAGDSEAIAKLAVQAWELLSDFNAHGERNQPWGAGTTSDSRIFRGWASTFDRECRTNRWLSRSGLSALLTASMRQGEIDLPGEILLIGFDRLTPAQQALLAAARAAGTVVSQLELPRATDAPQLIHAKDLRDELVTCAWWLRRKLEENPSANIAVVVPAADEMRGEVRRIFAEILMPNSSGIESSEVMPFEFSLGIPLATVPSVKAALLALRWLGGSLEQPAISWLALSGFLAADGEDLLEMAEFDAELRKRSQFRPEVSIEAFCGHRPQLASQAARGLCGRLNDFRHAAQLADVGKSRKAFPDWVATAELLLRRLRWPGARKLETVEFQARARWERVIGDIAALGFDGGRVGWMEFVTVLDRYAAETIFAPESRGAPIQIMGPLEGSGQDFDALWFLGANDRDWPGAHQPNPLLPLWLRRQAGMPHASSGEDWSLHLAIARRLAASAPACVFSYAGRDQQGDLRPSGLLTEAMGHALPAQSSEQLRALMEVPPEALRLPSTELTEDMSSIPWPAETHGGGADILKRQSACAFQSFAVRRLGAEAIDAAERGLTPLDRGNLVHKVMQSFWSEENPMALPMKSHRDLFHASVSGLLDDILKHHITRAFRELTGAAEGDPWWQAYLQVEQERLRSVLLQWLRYELDRTDFTVEACEKEAFANIHDVPLKLRVDRIDVVEGGRLILDYKTGAVSSAMWAGERPDEPQLPIYGVHGQVDGLRGVLFAQVRAGKMSLVGCAEDASTTISRKLKNGSGLIKNPLTAEKVQEWSAAIAALAGQFQAGEALVAPKSYPQTCRYCALPALCRVAETNIPIEAADEAAAEEDEAIEEDAIDD
jgi:ATP-dependent helicase/nuclease subunit B